MINKHYKDLKNIKKNTKQMDYYFMGKYHFSPYMACEHGCIYCDGRAEKYYVEGDFDQDIVIRRNLPELLKSKIPSYRENGTFLIGSGISDPYQPVESEEGIMKSCLSILSDTQHGISIMTKSDLILRDLDLIDKINQQSKALLMVSLVYPTDDHRKIFEPLASSVEKRLEMIQQFKARNIPVCVLAMPLLPRISDDPISVNNLFDKLSSLKVDAVMPGSLTLRPGRQKEHYLNTIKSSYPELLDFYQELYKNNSYSGSPEKWYVNKTLPMVYTALKERNLPTLLPHSIYKGSYPKYDELYFLLKHMKLLYRYNNVSIEPLKRAESSYSNWYIKNRSLFNRRRSMTQEEFEHLLWSELDNTYPTILNGNRKLTNFVKQAIFEDQTFDYIKLKLI
jgi:DNA repair photolyase